MFIDAVVILLKSMVINNPFDSVCLIATVLHEGPWCIILDYSLGSNKNERPIQFNSTLNSLLKILRKLSSPPFERKLILSVMKWNIWCNVMDCWKGYDVTLQGAFNSFKINLLFLSMHSVSTEHCFWHIKLRKSVLNHFIMLESHICLTNRHITQMCFLVYSYHVSVMYFSEKFGTQTHLTQRPLYTPKKSICPPSIDISALRLTSFKIVDNWLRW